uniref:AAA-type ATPase N-terminal domain-containing protein n=1 Tax=Salix viminalis TaxID=40686 RepID=A0A6N2KD91_SALVM
MLWQLTWQKKSKRRHVGFTFSFIFAAAFSRTQQFVLAIRLHLHISHLHCVFSQYSKTSYLHKSYPFSTPLLSLSKTLFPQYSYFDIPEFNGYCGVDINDLYRHVNLYLNSVTSSATASTCRRFSLSRSRSSNCISFTIAPNHTIHDSFNGHSLCWTHQVETVQDSLEEKRSFTLKLPKRHRHVLLSPYLQHVTSRAEEFERVSRERRLFTNNGNASYESGWVSVPFRHPSTFETLALESQLKRQIMEDLKTFASGKEFYHRVGRGMEEGLLALWASRLTKVTDNSELRALLIQTSNRLIIVIEDIDCSLDLTADRMLKATTATPTRRKRSSSSSGYNKDLGASNYQLLEESGRVTLSVLLNFTDGLWSCCGEERIIVFTTNHRDKVDPALVRCGRMDVHSCIRSGGSLTPAQIWEILLRNRGSNADLAMKEVVSAMQARILSTGGTEHLNTSIEYEETVTLTRSPQSVLTEGSSPEN